MSNETENEATALDDDDVVAATAAATSPDGTADAGAAAGAATTEPPDATVPTAGSVRIASSPKGATLTIDGEPHEGTTPMLVDELEPGSHEIGLSLDGHRPRSVTVAVEAGEQAELDVSLERKPRRARKRPRRRRPAVTGSGELRIASQPSCEVIIDGKARGQTPLAGIELRAGRHRLQLVNSRFGIDETYRIRIQADKVLKKRYTFPIE